MPNRRRLVSRFCLAEHKSRFFFAGTGSRIRFQVFCGLPDISRTRVVAETVPRHPARSASGRWTHGVSPDGGSFFRHSIYQSLGSLTIVDNSNRCGTSIVHFDVDATTDPSSRGLSDFVPQSACRIVSKYGIESLNPTRDRPSMFQFCRLGTSNALRFLAQRLNYLTLVRLIYVGWPINLDKETA